MSQQRRLEALKLAVETSNSAMQATGSAVPGGQTIGIADVYDRYLAEGIVASVPKKVDDAVSETPTTQRRRRRKKG